METSRRREVLSWSHHAVVAALNGFRWVANQIESVRRRTNLGWSHHRVVAALDPPEQDR